MKTPEMERTLDVLSKHMFGRSRLDCFESRLCVTCGGAARKFRNELSEKEYTISGMCQPCQDFTFGGN